MFLDDVIIFLGKPFELDQPIRARLETEHAELLEQGLKVTGIQLSGGEVPPRYDIAFPTDKPQYKVRAALEMKGYEVGQKLGSKTLGFYAAKRVKPSKGWED